MKSIQILWQTGEQDVKGRTVTFGRKDNRLASRDSKRDRDCNFFLCSDRVSPPLAPLKKNSSPVKPNPSSVHIIKDIGEKEQVLDVW